MVIRRILVNMILLHNQHQGYVYVGQYTLLGLHPDGDDHVELA